MKYSYLFLCVSLVLSSVAANAAVSLGYGTGEGQVAFMNPTSHPNQEELYSYGPQSFRCSGGEFWVADSVAGRILRISSEGKVVATIPIASTTEGLLEDVALQTDKAGKIQSIFVLAGHSQEILQFSPDGKLLQTLGGTGDEPGKFMQLNAIEVSSTGHLFVADYGKQTITVFAPDFKLLREIHWEWSGFCLDQEGNLCTLRWDEEAQETHLMIETFDGKPVKDVPLNIGAHTNPKLWSISGSGEAVLTFIPGEGYAGKYKIARFNASGQPGTISEIAPPVAMNRFIEQTADGSLFVGVANYDTAPTGSFKIEPFELK